MWIRSTPTTVVTKRYILITSSFISCTVHAVLLGWRCQRGMWHVREKCNTYTTTNGKILVLLKGLNKTTKISQSTFPTIIQPSYWWKQLTGQRATFPLRSRPTVTRNLAVKHWVFVRQWLHLLLAQETMHAEPLNETRNKAHSPL
jgi:hypothetical protein